MRESSKNSHTSIHSILIDENISATYKIGAIAWGIWHNRLSKDEVVDYLKNFEDKKSTEYKKLLCMFDYKQYVNDI